MLESDLKARLSAVATGEDFGEWDAFEGGGWDMTETKYTPADGEQRTYLSTPTTENLNISRVYEEARDGALVARRKQLQGIAVRVVILEKDINGIWQQNREPYVGKWKAITPPNGNSNDAGVAMIAGEVSTGTAGA